VIKLRYGDVNNNGSIERGVNAGNSKDEQYINFRLTGAVDVPDSGANNAIYRYDYRADLNRDGIVDNFGDKDLFMNTLSKTTDEFGDSFE
jgi:hypothetical protein